jgi:hypothetical protein
MKTFLKILGGLAVFVLLLVLVAFFLPRQYRIERTAVIKARPEVVHAQIADLRAWKSWGAWQERDPGMQITYSEKSIGVGAWSAWISKQEGSGKMTITSQTPTKVTYDLDFPDAGFKSVGSLELAADPAGASTKVTWVDSGDLGMNPMNRWFGLFLDKMMGPDFERGLSNIAKIVEKK